LGSFNVCRTDKKKGTRWRFYFYKARKQKTKVDPFLKNIFAGQDYFLARSRLGKREKHEQKRDLSRLSTLASP